MNSSDQYRAQKPQADGQRKDDNQGHAHDIADVISTMRTLGSGLGDLVSAGRAGLQFRIHAYPIAPPLKRRNSILTLSL